MFTRIVDGLPEMGRVRGEDFITLLARVVDLMVTLGPQAEHRLPKGIICISIAFPVLKYVAPILPIFCVS